MSQELLWAFGLLAVFVVWVIAKIVSYSRESDRQWEAVDKEKLRKWEDEVD